MKCKQTVAGLTRKKQTGLKAFSPRPRGNPTSTVEQMCRNSLRLQTFRFDCDAMDWTSVNCVRVSVWQWCSSSFEIQKSKHVKTVVKKGSSFTSLDLTLTWPWTSWLLLFESERFPTRWRMKLYKYKLVSLWPRGSWRENWISTFLRF